MMPLYRKLKALRIHLDVLVDKYFMKLLFNNISHVLEYGDFRSMIECFESYSKRKANEATQRDQLNKKIKNYL